MDMPRLTWKDVEAIRRHAERRAAEEAQQREMMAGG